MAVFTVAVSPYTAPDYDVFSPARRGDERGVVLGAPLDGAQSYTPWIGLSTVRELALKHVDKVGLVDAQELEHVQWAADVLSKENEQLAARVAELEATVERFAGVAADGYTVVKKVGRPAKKENS